MWMITRIAIALLLAASACSTGNELPTQPGAGRLDRTGLEGTARRGPVQPVCREGEPCDAPLQTTFVLQQNGRVVRRFASDTTGYFLVYTTPGTYVVVPEEPIGFGPQTLEVRVGTEGLTHVDLTFDTGIR